MLSKMPQRLVYLALTIASSLGSPLDQPYNSHLIDRRTAPIVPSADPFYHVPSNISSYAPGEIIGFRHPPSPIAAFTLDPVNLRNAWQILYRTNDNHDNPTATVLTVLTPYDADFSKLVSFQAAEDAACPDCAPSYALQFQSATGGPLGTLVTQVELLNIEGALSQGWVVVCPDHLGPQAAFLANKLSGQATLDGIRAAINSHSFTGINKDPTIAMWGYSGGSLATGWAAELQPTYAPELKIVGAALGGTIPSIISVVNHTNATPFAGLVPAGILGLGHQYPDLQALFDSHLLPQYKAAFAKVEKQCLVADIIDFVGKDVIHMVDDPSIFYTNPAKSIINANNMGKANPPMSLFVYHSANDEYSPVAETDALVSGYCSAGTSVTYERDVISDHNTLAIVGAPRAIAWLRDALNGDLGKQGCSTVQVASSLLDSIALEVLPSYIVNDLLDLLHAPAGKSFVG